MSKKPTIGDIDNILSLDHFGPVSGGVSRAVWRQRTVDVLPDEALVDSPNVTRLSQFSDVVGARQTRLAEPNIRIEDLSVPKQLAYKVLPVLMQADEEVVSRFVGEFAFKEPQYAVISRHPDKAIRDLAHQLSFKEGNELFDKKVQEILDTVATVSVDGKIVADLEPFLAQLEPEEKSAMLAQYNREQSIQRMVDASLKHSARRLG